MELLEEQLDQMPIEEKLFQVIHSILSNQTLENIDNNIIYILNTVRKKIKGLTRSIPYSKAMEIRRATLLFWKMKKK